MTITRIWQAGAETQSIYEYPTFGGAAAVTVSTTQKKTGAAAFLYGNSTNQQAYGIIPISATRQVRFGGFHHPALIQSMNWFAVLNASNTELVRIEFNADLSVEIFVANVSVATTASGITEDTWKHWGVDIKVDSSGGWVDVYRDGVLFCTFSGNTGNSDIGYARHGRGVNASDNGYQNYWDDIYIDDTTGESQGTKPPIRRFYFVTPNGNGNYSQWDGSDGNSTDNYLLVDDVPHDTDTTYITTVVADELDSFAMTTFTLLSGQQIVSVIPIALAKRNGTTEQLAAGTRLSSTDLIGSDQSPSSTYAPIWERQTTKPGSGSWTQADLDALEVVVKSRGTY